jgi:hypothetical protein
MVALGHLSGLAMLLCKLEGGLEEVYEQMRCAVQSCDGLCGGRILAPRHQEGRLGRIYVLRIER